MTTKVVKNDLRDLTTRVVNARRVSTRKNWQTLEGRLEWLLLDYNLSAREFSKRAGFKAETHMSTIIARLKDGRKIEHETLIRIQRFTNVSWEWLMEGEGPPWKSDRFSRLEQRSAGPNPGQSNDHSADPQATNTASGVVPTKLGKKVLSSLAKESRKKSGR